MINNPLKRTCFFVLLTGIMSILSFQVFAAQEMEPNDSLLIFIESSPIKSEVFKQITNVLESNLEKAKIARKKHEFSYRLGPMQLRHRQDWQYREIYDLQKLSELYQWQLYNSGNETTNIEIVKEFNDVCVQQCQLAKSVAEISRASVKVGVINIYAFVRDEVYLDQITFQTLDFQSTHSSVVNQAGENMVQIFKNNILKAESFLENYPEWIVFKESPVKRHLGQLNLDFYLREKQMELLRWHYENSEGDENRQSANMNLMMLYDQQLLTAQKMVELSDEIKQHEIPIDAHFYYKLLLDRVATEFMNFKLATHAEEEGALVAQMVDILQDNVKKAQDFCEAYENQFQEEMKVGGSQRRTTILGSFQTKFYFHQKQVELLRWQYKNAKETTERDELAQKLMEAYKEQWRVAKKMAVAAGEAHDVGICTMKDYLDCENMFDQTTLDMLYFMLNRAEPLLCVEQEE